MTRNKISRTKQLALLLGSAAILTCQPVAGIAQGFEEGSFNDAGSGAPQDGAGGGGEDSFEPGAGSGAQPGGGGFEEGSFEDGGGDPEPSPKVAQDPGPDDQVEPDPEPGGGSFEEGSFEDGNVGPEPGSDDPEPGPDPDEPDPKTVGGDDFDSGNFDDPDPRLVPPRPDPDSPEFTEPVVAVDRQIFAFETRDFGVPPQSQLRSGQFHAPTPTAVPGGKLVSTEGLLQAYTAGMELVVIDVLGNNYGLPNAYTATALAAPGNFQDRTQQQAAAWLSQITQGDNTVAIIVYCSDPMCWLSYNAALRVIAAGYTNVYWYRGGLQAWQMAGQQVQPTGF